MAACGMSQPAGFHWSIDSEGRRSPIASSVWFFSLFSAVIGVELKSFCQAGSVLKTERACSYLAEQLLPQVILSAPASRHKH